jgi:hypothetical protein
MFPLAGPPADWREDTVDAENSFLSDAIPG